MNYEDGMVAVQQGFLHADGHSFILYHSHGKHAKTQSGFGSSTVAASYGEYLHPNLDDLYTRTCYKEFLIEHNLVHPCSRYSVHYGT